MNWRKAIARVLVTTLLISTLAPAFAGPTRGNPPPPPPIGATCGKTGAAGSTPYCPPTPPSTPIIIVIPVNGWVLGK